MQLILKKNNKNFAEFAGYFEEKTQIDLRWSKIKKWYVVNEN